MGCVNPGGWARWGQDAACSLWEKQQEQAALPTSLPEARVGPAQVAAKSVAARQSQEQNSLLLLLIENQDLCAAVKKSFLSVKAVNHPLPGVTFKISFWSWKK